MADKGKQGPILVIRKKGGHGGHHGGAWKVAYADFVTAMMAFFMVMWIVGQSKAVKRNVASYFADPAAHAAKAAAGVLDGGEGVLKGSGPSVIEGQSPPAQEQAARAALARAGQEILEALVEIPGLKEMSQQVEVELTNEGLRIQLMEAGESTFFDLGSSKLSRNGVETVSAIARVIAPLNMDIAMEGHTDSRPFGGARGYTNWELSADRANSARRLLEENGVAAGRIAEIRGYADTRLRFPESPGDPRNRRISIIVFGRFHTETAKPPDAIPPILSPAAGPGASPESPRTAHP